MLKTGVRPKERCPDFSFMMLCTVLYRYLPLHILTYFISVLNISPIKIV